MKAFTSLDDLSAAVRSTVGPTDWFTIDQNRINAFADATGDHQWIHVDVERAAQGPFGGTIAHGFLTLSLIPQFAADLFSLEFGGARINYGLNKARFPAPVPAGARVRATAEFVELRPASAGQQLTTRYTVELENGSKPACVAETVTLLLP
ncbi:MaoC family dehydratase [Skermania sp. ID1734]|uniref:MaoC family dehydratase n=1 Tax=Skermania sp. ID1734 TaxID=2597516 RepID=UPI00117DED6B|nr:MaoC family dehydratase [Skermania sp. ID1734]TSD92956.1 MaoC family dehydratase [Skermania sp. ID1734]